MKRTLFTLALCLACFLASPAQAHRVNIFAFVDGDAVEVECGFNRSRKVRQGMVEVFDAATGEKLAQGLTDDKGVFRFPVSGPMVEAGHDLLVRIIAGEGHQNEWTVSADELKAATVAETASPASSTSRAASAPSPALAPAATVASASSAATPEEVERIVNAALDAKLSPIRHLLAEQAEAGPNLRDIVGGIGWVFGLVGVAAYMRRRRV